MDFHRSTVVLPKIDRVGFLPFNSCIIRLRRADNSSRVDQSKTHLPFNSWERPTRSGSPRPLGLHSHDPFSQIPLKAWLMLTSVSLFFFRLTQTPPV